MVCPRCTLLHAEPVLNCRQCGYQFRSLVRQSTLEAVRDVQLTIGVLAGGSLCTCLAVAVLDPVRAAIALSLGSYFGIVSIANSMVATYRQEAADWLWGMRGIVFSAALLYSLIAELARLQGASTIEMAAFGDLQIVLGVPSALVTEFLACVLIALDPLVAAPVMRWIGAGVDRTDGEAARRALR